MPSPKSTGQENAEVTSKSEETASLPAPTKRGLPDTWDIIVFDGGGPTVLEFVSEAERTQARMQLTKMRNIMAVEPVACTVHGARGTYVPIAITGVFWPAAPTKH